MHIKYCVYVLFALVFVSCDNKDSYTLRGNIKGLQHSELYFVSGKDLRIDTFRTKSGKFTYRGVAQTVEPLLIYMENGNIWTTLWVQNGEKFSLTGDARYPELIMVKGGEINKLLTAFKTENLSLIKEKCDLRDKLQHAESSESINNGQFFSQIKNIDQLLKMAAQDFVEANPSSIAALVMIQDYILDIENASEIKPYLDIVVKELDGNPLFEKLQNLCTNDLKTKTGEPALDFRIIDTRKDTISLEKFSNQYLILNFASSLCVFCEPEFDELKAIRKIYPEKELSILTISLDENNDDWKRLAEKKGIDWLQMVDTTGWASEMASKYNVITLPCNYLIDKNSIIIGSRLSVDSINSILTDKIKPKIKN